MKINPNVDQRISRLAPVTLLFPQDKESRIKKRTCLKRIDKAAGREINYYR